MRHSLFERTMARFSSVFLALFCCCAYAENQVPTLTPDQIRQDLAFLKDEWLPQDRSFSPDQRNKFNAVVAQAAANADNLTSSELVLEVSRAVAVARNGHTSVAMTCCLSYFHSLPVRMHWFADGLYIVRADPQFSALVGVKVLRFGSLTSEQALQRVASYISGTDVRIRELSGNYLALLEVLAKIGASTDASNATLTIKQQDGRQQKVTLASIEATDPLPMSLTVSWGMLLASNKDVSGQWSQALDGLASTPLAFDRPADLFIQRIGEHQDVLYLRSNWIVGNDPDHYGLFDKLYGALQNELAPKQPKKVVIDLRLNNGGDFSNTIVFAQALAKTMAPNGRIAVLIGPATFSAAIITAAMLKQYGDGKVVFIGEPVGDASPFWSEGRPTVLPNSKIQVWSAAWMNDWETGCKDEARCYWANRVFWKRAISLKPDVYVPLTFAQYLAGYDPVLNAALTTQ